MYQENIHRRSHCGNAIIRSSYLHNGNSYTLISKIHTVSFTNKTASVYILKCPSGHNFPLPISWVHNYTCFTAPLPISLFSEGHNMYNLWRNLPHGSPGKSDCSFHWLKAREMARNVAITNRIYRFQANNSSVSYRWLSARLQYLQCISNGDTTVLH